MAERHAIAVIPARMASVRFPGKVLAADTGRPLIRHVYDAARAAGAVARVVIATDDPRVEAAARAFNAEVVLTSPVHPNGTSRIAEACDRLAIRDPRAVVVNVQGDEPELDPLLIDEAVAALLAAPDTAPVATVAAPFQPGEDPADPNAVKVVRRLDGRALYFTRAPVPFPRDGPPHPHAAPLRHIGLYAYRHAFLARYAALEPTPLEATEKLEQLRILEHGTDIAVAVAAPRWPGAGIDTPEQYRAFVQRWKAANPDG